jgi:hypothetical protein
MRNWVHDRSHLSENNLSMNNKVLLIAALLLFSSNFEPRAFAYETPELTTKSSDCVSQIEAQMAPLLKQYFPRAVVKKTADSYHVDFKAAKFATVDGGMLLTPKTDGIVFDVEVKPGKYRGRHVLPLTTNETLYYSILWVLYSPSENNHVIVKLLCPPDINISISDDLREAVQDVVGKLEARVVASAAPAAPQSIRTVAEVKSPDTNISNGTPGGGGTPQIVAAESSNAKSSPSHNSVNSDTVAKSEPVSKAETAATSASSVLTDKAAMSEKSVAETSSKSPDKAADAATGVANAAEASSGNEERGAEFDLGVLKDAIANVSIPAFSATTTPTAGDNAFAPSSKTSAVAPVKAAAKVPPKASPKPNREYFKAWFAKFYKTMEASHYMQDVLPFFSNDFRQTKLRGVERLNAVASNMVYKQFRKQTHLSEWSLEKAQPGPLGCWDVIVNGRTFSGHPAYLIYRMVPEGGTWRIDNGRGRFWTSGSREI